MSMKGQGSSSLVIVVLVIAVIAIVYLYYGGYINLGTTPSGNSSVSPTPIALSASSITSLSNVFPSQNLQIVSTITNNRNSPITVSILPYGCSTISQGAISKTIPGGVQVSVPWSFTAPASGSCQFQFTTCFDYSAHATYPLTIKNGSLGTAPITSPTFSNSPVSLSLKDFSNTLLAPPQSIDPKGINETEYVLAENVGSGSVFNSTLNWLDIHTTGQAYFQLVNGVSPVFNISGVAYTQTLAFNNNFALPFYLTVPVLPPSVYPSGYTTQLLNISAGFTYCLQSNAVFVSVS